MSEATITLRPGDPPPFWDGPWHPEGKAEGAVVVRPLKPGESFAAQLSGAAPAAAAPSPAPAQAPASPPPTAPAPTPPPAAPIAMGPPPEAAPTPAPPPVAPPAQPAAAAQGQPTPAQAQPAAAQGPRSYVLSLAAQAPLASVTAMPTQADPAASEALRKKAKELQAANQLGTAMQALTEALRRSPGDPANYGAVGQVLLAGRAWEDAAHHFLIAYMLSPKEPSFGRMTLHASFVLGYAGWAFQLAQALYKLQPAQDLIDIGRQCQGWLQQRPPAVTALCTACRTPSILTAPGPCPKCGTANPIGAPCNAAGFMGLRLLQQGAPNGRLFAGAACANCYEETLLLVTKGGPRCQSCHEPALAAV